jgi:outer membrane protein assembly factor BamB
LNVVPAIAPDGTIYTVSRAHANSRYAYVIAARPDLTPLWSASLRGFLDDGCDVLLPPSGTPGGCRAGSTRGVDPATNNRPAARIWDVSTSSPVVLPDGAVLFGTETTYNYQRGHLLKFSPEGQPLAAYDFGWDSTPAVFQHGDTYSILIKDNHYELGSYCGDPTFCPREAGRFDFVSLDPNLLPEWRFTNANTQSCRRQSDGSVTCVPSQPEGFEWCINQPAVDARGVVYANSEDGFLYAIGPDGKLREKIFLDLARAAAYTPVSIGPDGLVYCQNNGHLLVVGNPFSAARIRTERAHAPRVKAFQ